MLDVVVGADVAIYFFLLLLAEPDRSPSLSMCKCHIYNFSASTATRHIHIMREIKTMRDKKKSSGTLEIFFLSQIKIKEITFCCLDNLLLSFPLLTSRDVTISLEICCTIPKDI